jgi:hypothetical protein
MIARASGLGMGVDRFSRLLREVGLIARQYSGLDTTRRVEVPLGAGALLLFVTSVAVGVCIDRRSVVNGVELIR